MSQLAHKRLIETIGDIDPLGYGGGFIFEHPETGGPEIEYYEPDDDSQPESPDEIFTVSRVLVEEYDWVDWSKVAESCGVTVEYYKLAFAGNDASRMAHAIRDAAGYYGWFEFDSEPLRLTRTEAEERIERLFGK
jgi:hypothetical protein